MVGAKPERRSMSCPKTPNRGRKNKDCDCPRNNLLLAPTRRAAGNNLVHPLVGDSQLPRDVSKRDALPEEISNRLVELGPLLLDAVEGRLVLVTQPLDFVESIRLVIFRRHVPNYEFNGRQRQGGLD